MPIANILNFPFAEKWQTFKYLGIPICLKSLPSTSWNQILDKIKAMFHQWGSFWLNLAGRVVLIKYVLSTLPIFQFSLLLTPCRIKSAIAQELWRFLRQGGRTNSKRFHLINWNIIKAPKACGGLGIKDPSIFNIALGSKILWRLVIGKNEWWKKVIVHKYLSGERLGYLDMVPMVIGGSKIWKLLKASISLIKN